MRTVPPSRTRWLTGIAGTLAMLLTAGAHADRARRCGTQLIRPGDTRAEVLAVCGEPLIRELISGGEGADSAVVEQWHYTLGTRRFTRVLTFRGLTLEAIQSGYLR